MRLFAKIRFHFLMKISPKFREDFRKKWISYLPLEERAKYE